MPSTPPVPRRPRALKFQASPGFSLVELAIVLIVAGILVGTGYTAWISLKSSREIAKTASILQQVKDCLVRRAVFDERYPSFNSTTALCADMTLDVDACLCQPGLGTDTWKRPVYYLAGVDAIGGLGNAARQNSIITDQARNQTRTAPAAASNATDHLGAPHPDVAFILLSYGPDGKADSTTYGNRFPVGRQANFLDSVNRPDFQTGHRDDIYLIVTSRELMDAIRQE